MRPWTSIAMIHHLHASLLSLLTLITLLKTIINWTHRTRTLFRKVKKFVRWSRSSLSIEQLNLSETMTIWSPILASAWSKRTAKLGKLRGSRTVVTPGTRALAPGVRWRLDRTPKREWFRVEMIFPQLLSPGEQRTTPSNILVCFQPKYSKTVFAPLI